MNIKYRFIGNTYLKYIIHYGVNLINHSLNVNIHTLHTDFFQLILM